MWNWIKTGWTMAWQQPFAVFALFVYNLIWGIALYKLIQSVVLPLLHRYPGNDLPVTASQLFWVEGHFQIMKTDLLEPYLWWGLLLLILRMLLHPMLNAGVYYSLRHRELNAGYRFVEGVRTLALPFLGLYVIQLVLTLLPLYWLIPYTMEQYGQQASYVSLGKALAPALAAYIIYWFVLQLLFLFLQIGKTEGKSVVYTLLFVIRHLPVIMLAALAVTGITLAVSAAVMASAFFWAGFLALIGLQAYRLAQMFFKIWAIGTQYALWTEKA
ncbi:MULTISPECIES: hypothetical protein [unclassified Paenibacillus]|uniref:hypothetical protein n=1 Tax=unclassified Paenibacillus TaxID=185978 RepID=UPI001AEB9727|nr:MULTISPECIES: hypothetical protein [unclassified Paenibacillus]MBP1153425.1 hypothetical protein [Paenibacillus sp. PvP091]MBP1171192.1 hypothetical protein [Paenibacillus sp. PvR098]MBP2442220.1 hypothetical protein [Paenibacillus sp. PvP052]